MLELLPGFGPGKASLPTAFCCSLEASADPCESRLIPVVSRLETIVFLAFYQRIQSKTRPCYCEIGAFVKELLEAVALSGSSRTAGAKLREKPICLRRVDLPEAKLAQQGRGALAGDAVDGDDVRPGIPLPQFADKRLSCCPGYQVSLRDRHQLRSIRE